MSAEPSGAPFGVLAPEVVLDDITTIIDDHAVLYGLNLVVPAGKVTVLMGPSGSGKTTLIKHIVGLLEPNGGAVRFDGADIWDSSPDEWQQRRKSMGAMLGGHNLYSTSLFSSYTVLGNLTYSLETHKIPEDERISRSRARLREVLLAEDEARTPDQLPAHARKRLALARALVIDAPFTVLDEIDVGMDHLHSQAMMEAVRGMRARTGCTLLLTTHNLELAREMADHLAILVNGRIVAAGPPGEVLDGVQTTEDFDRRFEFSDEAGPPRLEQAEAAVGQRRPKGARRPGQLAGDRKMIIGAVLALVLIAVVFVAVKLLG